MPLSKERASHAAVTGGAAESSWPVAVVPPLQGGAGRSAPHAVAEGWASACKRCCIRCRFPTTSHWRMQHMPTVPITIVLSAIFQLPSPFRNSVCAPFAMDNRRCSATALISPKRRTARRWPMVQRSGSRRLSFGKPGKSGAHANRETHPVAVVWPIFTAWSMKHDH